MVVGFGKPFDGNFQHALLNIVTKVQLLQFGIDSVLKILNKMVTGSSNESMDQKGVSRTAPTTQGLLNS